MGIVRFMFSKVYNYYLLAAGKINHTHLRNFDLSRQTGVLVFEFNEHL